MTKDRSFSHLVVVGSSAGGIEALSQLVSALPEKFPAPIVIAQHLDPDSESHLKEILSRKSVPPVRTVTDHEPLEAGVVFVVPANHHVNISDSEIELAEDGAGRPMPSVDRLMESAAGVYGESLIAVVLTGTGTDGAQGARAVRRAGGTVVVQDPESAEFRGMPASIAPNTVDIVARLERIGAVLQDLLSGMEVSERVNPEEERRSLQWFLEELREARGMDFTSYKTPTIMRRLKRRMVATETGDIGEYAEYVREHPEQYRRLVNAFLIKVTEFFRDPELFTYLKEEVLPELLADAGERGAQLRIWSAGCATGEEAYSLAILVSEILGQEAGVSSARIFATDVDEEAVEFARQGCYPASALKGLSEERIERYFSWEGGQYRIRTHIRSMIVFGEHDLARRSPFPRMDLVMSRNVLIYFTAELQRRALLLFAYSLRDGGYLVLGKAEAVSPLGEFFAPQQRQQKVYQRQGERFLMPPLSPTLPKQRQGSGGVWPGARDASEMRRELRQSRLADEGLLNGIPVGLVIVDRRYDIRAINAAARGMFSIRGVAVGEDFLHLLQDVPYTQVREAIDAAFRDGEHTRTGEFAIEDVATGEPRYLRISCHPRREEGEEAGSQTVAVVIHDVTEAVRERYALEARLDETRKDFERLKRETEAEVLRHETHNKRLIAANRQLDEANRELTALNEDLSVVNEESLLSTEESQAATEESQAATEEVETLNEELQATNEELETLNEELQATVEELNTTNDDLQARSAELQDLARARSQERQESERSLRLLEATLRSMSDAVLAVGPEGETLFCNEAFVETFGEVRDDESAAELLGNRALLAEDGERLAHEKAPRVRASRGESFQMPFVVDDEDGARRLFEVRGQSIEDGETNGGVIVICEIFGKAG